MQQSRDWQSWLLTSKHIMLTRSDSLPEVEKLFCIGQAKIDWKMGEADWATMGPRGEGSEGQDICQAFTPPHFLHAGHILHAGYILSKPIITRANQISFIIYCWPDSNGEVTKEIEAWTTESLDWRIACSTDILKSIKMWVGWWKGMFVTRAIMMESTGIRGKILCKVMK